MTTNVYQLNFKNFNASKTKKCNELNKIIHDIRSPLQTLQIIRNGHFDDQPIYKKELTDRCLQRIRGLVSHNGESSSESICIPNLVASIKKLKEVELNIKIKIKMQLDDGWIKSPISAEKIENIFSNLINNAVQAHSSPDQISITVKQNKNAISFSLTDKGDGINRDNLQKIGTLGHTTKTHGQGVGLNNAIREITSSGGKISCRTIPNLGTQFSFNLPL